MWHLLDKPFLEAALAAKAPCRELSGSDVVGSHITQSLHDWRCPPETLHVTELMKNVGNDSRHFTHFAEFNVGLLTQLHHAYRSLTHCQNEII